MDELLEEYNSNYDMTNALALETVSKIEVPICIGLSSLSKYEFTQLLHNIYKRKMLSTSEKCLLLTLVTDAVTIMLKNQEFYESFYGNNSFIIYVLCKQTTFFTSMVAGDLDIVLRYVVQMLKYAERIPDYPELGNSLKKIKELSFSGSSTSSNRKIIQTSISGDVQKENKAPNSLKRVVRGTKSNKNEVKGTAKNDITLKKRKNSNKTKKDKKVDAERIPDYPELGNSLKKIKELSFSGSSTSSKRKIIQTSIPGDVQKENKVPNSLKGEVRGTKSNKNEVKGTAKNDITLKKSKNSNKTKKDKKVDAERIADYPELGNSLKKIKELSFSGSSTSSNCKIIQTSISGDVQKENKAPNSLKREVRGTKSNKNKVKGIAKNDITLKKRKNSNETKKAKKVDAERIPDYPELGNSFKKIKELSFSGSSTSSKRKIIQTSISGDVQKENKVPNSLKGEVRGTKSNKNEVKGTAKNDITLKKRKNSNKTKKAKKVDAERIADYPELGNSFKKIKELSFSGSSTSSKRKIIQTSISGDVQKENKVPNSLKGEVRGTKSNKNEVKGTAKNDITLKKRKNSNKTKKDKKVA